MHKDHGVPELREIIQRCRKLLSLDPSVDKIEIVITVKRGDEAVPLNVYCEDRSIFTKPILKYRASGKEEIIDY